MRDPVRSRSDWMPGSQFSSLSGREIAGAATRLPCAMEATDENTFLVVGYLAAARSNEDGFEGYCIAVDKSAALALMAERIPLFHPTGASSLAQLRQYVAALEKVRTGLLPAPKGRGFQ